MLHNECEGGFRGFLHLQPLHNSVAQHYASPSSVIGDYVTTRMYASRTRQRRSDRQLPMLRRCLLLHNSCATVANTSTFLLM